VSVLTLLGDANDVLYVATRHGLMPMEPFHAIRIRMAARRLLASDDADFSRMMGCLTFDRQVALCNTLASILHETAFISMRSSPGSVFS
jgi:hypothetical protein